MFGVIWFIQKQLFLQFFFDLQTKGCRCHDICANKNKKKNWLLFLAKPYVRWVHGFFYAAFWISIILSRAASGAVSPYSMDMVTKGSVHWHSASSAANSRDPVFWQRSKSSVPVLTDSFAFAGSWKIFSDIKGNA